LMRYLEFAYKTPPTRLRGGAGRFAGCNRSSIKTCRVHCAIDGEVAF